MAMSVDGKVSSRSREPVTFTSPEDKRHLLKIRSQCDALVVAARTALDYETMGIPSARLRAERARRGQDEHPVRVIVSGNLSLPANLRVFKSRISPILIACCETATRARRNVFARSARVIACGRREVNLRRLVKILATEYNVRIILCEGGPTLNDAFFRAGLVNELHLTLCPRIVGGKDAPTLSDGTGFQNLKQAAKARLVSCRKAKSEWFLRYKF